MGVTRTNRLLLTVPDDWRHIPLQEDAALVRVVNAIADRQFHGLDDKPVLKRNAAAALLEQARDAREGGGVDMYLGLATVADVPLSMSLVVSLLPAPPGHIGLRTVARELDAPEARAELIELPNGPAVRRRQVSRPPRIDTVGAPEELEVVLVDYSSRVQRTCSFSCPSQAPWPSWATPSRRSLRQSPQPCVGPPDVRSRAGSPRG